MYKSKFIDLWGKWVALLRQGEVAPNFLKRFWFVIRQWLSLREKVRGRFPTNYDMAIEVAPTSKIESYVCKPKASNFSKMARKL